MSRPESKEVRVHSPAGEAEKKKGEDDGTPAVAQASHCDPAVPEPGLQPDRAGTQGNAVP